MSSVSYENPPEATVHGHWLPDGHPGYPALIGGLWNGWAEPLVTAEVAKRLCEDQEKLRAELVDDAARAEVEELRFDEERNAIICRYDGEESVIEPRDVDGSEEQRFSVGLGWTWDVGEELPGSPTEAQRETVKRLREEGVEGGEFAFYSHVVRADGSHVFAVLVVDEERSRESDENPRGMTYKVPAARIIVAPDGGVAREEVNPDGAA